MISSNTPRVTDSFIKLPASYYLQNKKAICLPKANVVFSCVTFRQYQQKYHFFASDVVAILVSVTVYIYTHGATAPSGLWLQHYLGVTITHRHNTFGRTPLDEGSARSRDLYLTTHNTHNRQTSMSPVGFEPAIPASKRPHTHALDSAATGIGLIARSKYKCKRVKLSN
jgi:hypothetical protein